MRRLILAHIILCLASCASTNRKLNEKNTAEFPPKLLAPSVKKIWIPPQLKDGGQEWQEGHYIYRIERGTSWSR
jgi:hypothetical protein